MHGTQKAPTAGCISLWHGGAISLKPEQKKSTQTEQEEVPEYPEKLTDGLYRVRRNWADGNGGQIGAYRFLSNAKKRADNNPGYSVFTDDGVAIYPMAEKASTADPEETYRVHTVGKGDTLFEIAKAYLSDGGRYREIRTLNGLASDTIYVGMKLKIPD